MRNNKKVSVAIASLSLVVLLLVGCESAKIADVTRDPNHYAGKDVTLAGRVTNSFGLMSEGAFEIEDGTGHIWILSGGYGVPSKGARVAVTGRVESGFSLAGKSFGTILRETRRRHGG